MMNFYFNICKVTTIEKHVGLKNQLSLDLNEQNLKQKKAVVLKFTKVIVPGKNFRFKNSIVGAGSSKTKGLLYLNRPL